MAFSVDTKIEIYNRAASKSELSGETVRPLECSHLTHDKSLPEYNDPDMAVLCTDIEHYAYHLIFRRNPEHIGLTWNQNDWSIDECWKRVLNNSRKLGWDHQQTIKALHEARTMWFYYLGIEG